MRRTKLAAPAAFLTILAALTLILAGPAEAAKPRVAVLPFLIHAKEGDPDLASELQSLLLPSLVSPRLEVIPTQDVAEAVSRPTLEPRLARETAEKLKAEWVVFGSMTRIGDRISVDILVADVKAETPPQSLYRQGQGEESLKEMALSLGREIKSIILGLKVVKAVKINGNRRIEPEAITVLLRTRVGDPVDPELLNDDIKTIYRMGYFSNVLVRTERESDGSSVIFDVVENPAIRDMDIKAGKVGDKEINEALNIELLSVFNPQSVSNGLERVAELYREKGYLNVKTSYRLVDVKDGLATLKIKIDYGKKVYIEDIKFSGNRQVPAKVLRKQMETTDWGILSFFTSSGVLKRDMLDKDLEKIKAYYQNNGYIKAVVGDPEITVTEEKIEVVIHIEEGNQYRVGTIDFTGDLVKPAAAMRALLGLKKGQIYSRSTQEIDRDRVTEQYARQGYARVRVGVRPVVDEKKRTVSLTYKIIQGPKIYLERIIIRGNTRTRDKIIRREMMLKEGDLFDLTKLRRSSFNLRRLGFFEAVDFKNLPGTKPNQTVLQVDVKEKQTGMLNFGIGYSTEDSLVVTGDISENNLFGRGQQLVARGSLGFKTSRGSLTFTEPWFLDIPLRLSVSLYSLAREYTDYDKDSIGGYVSLGYPLWPRFKIRGSVRYTYEDATVSNIEEGASVVIREQEGPHSTSSLTFTLNRDTRDAAFNATRGSRNFITAEYAGLGGTNAFTKLMASSAWFFPMIWGTNIGIHGKIGHVVENSGGLLPLYEKFYLGGINSIRGFPFASISPRDPVTDDRIGGEKMLQFNLEFVFPLLREAGVKGLVFYDAGNVWNKDQSYDFTDLMQSVGVGVRWYSPIGPLRLEYGHILRGRDDHGSGAWEFSIGSVF